MQKGLRWSASVCDELCQAGFERLSCFVCLPQAWCVIFFCIHLLNSGPLQCAIAL